MWRGVSFPLAAVVWKYRSFLLSFSVYMSICLCGEMIWWSVDWNQIGATRLSNCRRLSSRHKRSSLRPAKEPIPRLPRNESRRWVCPRHWPCPVRCEGTSRRHRGLIRAGFFYGERAFLVFFRRRLLIFTSFSPSSRCAVEWSQQDLLISELENC